MLRIGNKLKAILDDSDLGLTKDKIYPVIDCFIYGIEVINDNNDKLYVDIQNRNYENFFELVND